MRRRWQAFPSPVVRRLLLFALSLLLALGVARYHTLAFPQLSPRFSLKKHDVPAAAAALAARLGLHPEGYRRAVTFSERDNDKTFLELEYGPERVAAEAERGVALWSWSTRFFKPGELEEFSIGLDTEGQLVNLRHTIPEDEVRPRLMRDEARARAEAFLAANVPRHPVAELKLTETERRPTLVDDQTGQLPGRPFQRILLGIDGPNGYSYSRAIAP